MTAPGRFRVRAWERWLLVVLMGVFIHSSLWRHRAGEREALPAPSAAAAPAPPTGIYSEDEIAFFLEISLGAEYGASDAVLRKWTRDIVLEVVGAPTGADLALVERLAEEASALQSSVQVRLATQLDAPNLQIVFAPQREFFEHEPNYVPPNPAYFWVRWNEASEIVGGRILVDTSFDPARRAALLREELTQALGLLNTSSGHPESVLNDNADSHPLAFAPIDERLIEMLFRPEVRAGMRAAQLDSLLRTLGSPGGAP